ncbi:hypothetical protein OSB04_027729 [Centaurea solstitialis]|uniref:Transposase-associated domain-containing protein n=1 Tax=Centaurea solstitialis TaxID=347529 RepID=A0AA38SZB0_9ASTR|nr:hypothetical protein OSB04_027729 [Centaurea solstitialis]
MPKIPLDFEGKCCCPCCNCNNVEFGTLELLECHIHTYGFSRAYTTWVYHGEPRPPSKVSFLPQTSNEMREALNDVLQETIGNDRDTSTNETNNEPVEGPSATNTDLDELFSLANTELYPGCYWISSLDFLAKISHMKAMNH